MISFKEYYTVLMLMELTKTWRRFCEFRVVCTEFPNAELLLNSLVTQINTNIDDLQIDEIISNNMNKSKDILAIKTIWNMSLEPNIIQIVSTIFDQSYDISDDDQKLFFQNTQYLLCQDDDPILKFFLFHTYTLPIVKKYPYKNEILRVLGLYFLHIEGIMAHPILYHNHHLNLIDFAETISEKNIIYFLVRLQNICTLGTIILKIYSQKIIELKKILSDDYSLSKFILNPHVFAQIFGKNFHTISLIMNEFNWKRDKTSRLLNKLCQKNIFIEKKFGKDKLFINNVLFSTFTEVAKNPQIHKLTQ